MGVGINWRPLPSRLICSVVMFLMCSLFASKCALRNFVCLILLCSLRFLFAGLILFGALCLLPDSENRHLYCLTCLFVISCNCNITSLNSAIFSLMFSANLVTTVTLTFDVQGAESTAFLDFCFAFLAVLELFLAFSLFSL